MTDIVERLRTKATVKCGCFTCLEAADEIERLRAVEKSAIAMCDSYADENQRFHDEIERLRAEIESLKSKDRP